MPSKFPQTRSLDKYLLPDEVRFVEDIYRSNVPVHDRPMAMKALHYTTSGIKEINLVYTDGVDHFVCLRDTVTGKMDDPLFFEKTDRRTYIRMTSERPLHLGLIEEANHPGTFVATDKLVLCATI